MKASTRQSLALTERSRWLALGLSALALVLPRLPAEAAAATSAAPWTLGTPIVTYWAGPAMTDANARQMADGGWNLVWCTEKELEVARRHGLRAQLTDPLLVPASLDQPGPRQQLDALIARVRQHPALYSYYLTDEPNATNFPALGRLVAHLREQDPAHLAYLNLFPTYATNEQLGNRGDRITAYQEHLRQYVDLVKPDLISYDHYQFATRGDNDQYFLNLALIRRAALDAHRPFLNIVQACTWTPSMRVPTGDEMRYLVSTTLAYGAQGISYYVYCHPGHTGAIAHADGTPTPLYHALTPLNREFIAIARELQPLTSVGVYHAGMRPPGTEPLPADSSFRLDPPVWDQEYRPPEPVKGVLLGCFGLGTRSRRASGITHVWVVNLDYQTERELGIRGPSRLEIFDAATAQWSRADARRIEVRLARGGGVLVRASR